MHSGEEIVAMYEKQFHIRLPKDRYEFLKEAIDNALKEVLEGAREDVLRIANKLAKGG